MLLALLFLGLAGPQQVTKPPVPYSAYDGWNAIHSTSLSRNGQWLVYALVPEDGDGTLVARNLATGVEHRAPRGENPVLTADGRFVVFNLAPTRAARDAAKRKADGKPPKPVPGGFGTMDLSTGALFTVDKVKSFALPENGSAYVAYWMEPPHAANPNPDTPEPDAEPADSTKPAPASDLVIRNLSSGVSITVPGVTDYAWSRDGASLAYATRSGVSLWTPEAPRRDILTDSGDSAQLTWNQRGDALAFVHAGHAYLAEGTGSARPLADRALPSGDEVSPHGKLSFSRDGQRLFVGIAPKPDPPPADAAPITHVDLWSWTDTELQPMQKVRANEERDASYPAVFDLGAQSGARELVPLGSPELPTLMLSADAASAVLSTDAPYKMAESWQGDAYDYYAVNLTDGTHRLLLHDAHFPATLSPGGRYLLYFGATDSHWHTIRLRDGKNTDLTAGLSVKFQDERWDQPSPARPYGTAGWTANDASVLLYDRYDIWTAAPDGGAIHNLTNASGRAAHLVFRYQQLDPKAKVIPAASLLLSATNDDTMATGFYRLASASTPESPRKLLMRDADLGAPVKAKDADTLAFTEQRFDQFPNLWISDGTLASPRQVSDANPQQSQYRWGSARLIHYINRDGKRLAATLITPDGFDPHKQYPLMVYIYERLSQNLNHYVPPATGTTINLTRYVSHGYVVLEPDIVYDVGYPGDSALKCVLPAIESVQAMGFIDPHRIGIEGHSWGGYEVAYMITRTDKFRAVEAGAVVADMPSAYGGIRWGTGMSREFQYEHTQSRIGEPPWDNPTLYVQNSPLFSVTRVHTPYLTIQNDADDAVPWYQGIEFFTALRRLHKPAWFFVFNGEKHGLRQRDNQKYWTVRMDEYFDYWLKQAPEPVWMKSGVPYLQRGQESVASLFAPTPSTAATPPPTSHRNH